MERGFPYISERFDSLGFDKYKHVWTTRPLGLLFNDKENIVTVDLSIGDDGLVPFLVSFDKNGTKLDSLGPYDRARQDVNTMTISNFKVNANKQFVIIDTNKRWETDNNGDEILSTETKTIDSTIYTLSKKGKFIKIAKNL